MIRISMVGRGRVEECSAGPTHFLCTGKGVYSDTLGLKKRSKRKAAMGAYIEAVTEIGVWRLELTDADLQAIGKFTRANISMWFTTLTDCGWWGVLPEKDFHAVCGDIDIPWATEESADCYRRTRELAANYQKPREVTANYQHARAQGRW
jgi:hypothetical protein